MNLKYSTKSLLMATMTTATLFAAAGVQAQEVTNVNWVHRNFEGATGSQYGVDGSWTNITTGGTPFVPSYEFMDYGTISSVGGIEAVVSNTVASSPLSLFVGDAAGEEGTLTVNTGGALTIKWGSSSISTSSPVDPGTNNQAGGGRIVIGRAGTGTLKMRGGTLTGATDIDGAQNLWMIVGSFNGGTGEVDMTGGTIALDPVSSIMFFGFTGGNGTPGTGTLNMSGGTIIAGRVQAGGTADSAVNLSGSAKLTLANLNIFRKITIAGSNVDVTASSAFLGSEMVVAPDHATNFSAIKVTTGATIGGSLYLDLSDAGAAPAVGSSWMIVDNQGAGAVAGSFSNVTSSFDGNGIRTVAKTDAGDGNDIVVMLESALTLTVNRTTGVASITDFQGGIDIGMLQLMSSTNSINTGVYSSIGNDFDLVSDTSNEIVETNLSGSKTYSVGEVQQLGVLFDVDMPVGQQINASLSYLDVSDNTVKQAIVEMEGATNNIILRVNKTTGEVMIDADIAKNLGISAYGIASASGSLVPANKQSADPQFDPASATANHIGESVLDDEVILIGGATVSLGNIFDTSSETEDLAFEFYIIGDGTDTGNYVQEGQSRVNNADLAYVKSKMGTEDADLQSMFNVRNNFGKVSEDARIANGVVIYEDGVSASAIPEPTTFALIGLSTLLMTSRRKKS